MTTIKLLLTLTACLLQADKGHSHGALAQCSPWPPAFMEDNCNSPDASKFMFEITSHRNRTGHWVTKAQLKKCIQQKQLGWELLRADLDQCEGEDFVDVVAAVTAPPPTPPAAPGYKLTPGLGYYKFHTVGKTWDAARRTCDQEGAHLAIINSEAERDVLTSLYRSAPKLRGVKYNQFAYLGFHDRFSEGEYVTVLGRPLRSTGYNPWLRGQPDNAGRNENCGSLHRNGGLNDIPCLVKLAFFCELEI